MDGRDQMNSQNAPGKCWIITRDRWDTTFVDTVTRNKIQLNALNSLTINLHRSNSYLKSTAGGLVIVLVFRTCLSLTDLSIAWQTFVDVERKSTINCIFDCPVHQFTGKEFISIKCLLVGVQNSPDVLF